MRTHRSGRGRWPLPRLLLLAALLAVPLGACDTEELLNVEDPEFAPPERLRTLEGLPVLVAGAISDFYVGYGGRGGSVDGFLSVTGVLTDEFYSSGTFPTRTALDQRDPFPAASGNASDEAFNLLQNARRTLDEVTEIIAEISGNPQDPRLAELKSLEGFALVALGEGWCNAIPLSKSRRGAIVEFGDPLTTDQVFQLAVDRFNEALAINPGYNLAKVGKGRALLNQGKIQEAAEAVAGVPTGFIYFIEHSANTTRQQNSLNGLIFNGRYGVSNDEGGAGPPFGLTGPFTGEGLEFLTEKDPRVPYTGPVAGFDRSIPQFRLQKYPDFGSDVPLGDGIEARLIEAEAALQAGNIDLWLSILNDLRKNVLPLMTARAEKFASFVPGPNNLNTTLPPLEDPGTHQARVDLTFHERGFWLYATGHRLGDLRRLVRQYGRNPNEAFPAGAYFKGGTYGNAVALPIPFDEANNPNFEPAMCDITKA